MDTMNNTPSRRAWLIGLALGVPLALLLSPATRWLVRSQMDACGLTLRTPGAQVRRAEEARRNFVASHPDDLSVQMAAAPQGGDRASRVAALRALAARFPDSPSLYANLLRRQIGDSQSNVGVYLSREEDYGLSGPPPADYKVPPPPPPALLAAYDRDAAQGERLDPDNAYFPLMRAVGLFAARRDAEGLDAVRRAGAKSVWREYMEDETNGGLRLADAAYGHGPAVSRAAIAAAVLYPQYAGLRGVARVAIAKAAQSEQQGQTEKGLTIRRAVLHSGSLMRVQSSAYIGNLVGIAIAAIATARPGGAPLPGNGPGERLSGDERARLRLQAFDAYARRIGRPEDAGRAQTEADAGQAVRAVWRAAEDRSFFGVAQMARLMAWWAAGLLSLGNAFWLLLLGILAGRLSRLPAVREGLPLPRPARAGVVAALIGATLFAAYAFGGGEMGLASAALAALGLALVLGVSVVRLRRQSPSRAAVPFAQAFGVTALALLALAGLAAWQGHGLLAYAGGLRLARELSGAADSAAAGQSQEMLMGVILGGLAVPLLLLLILSIAGRVRRVPISVALVRGFGGAGTIIGCLLLMAYGALVLGTLRQERAANDGLRQMVQHEGRYYAALAGRPWPQ